MKRPVYIWISFACSLALAVGAMIWINSIVLSLDRTAGQEENVRLALWRMDSALAPLIAREGSRPYFVYTAFHGAARAYTRMFAAIEPNEVLLPSPLLTQLPDHVLLHFQIDPSGRLTSPQAPEGNMRDLAESGYVDPKTLIERDGRLEQLREIIDRQSLLSKLKPLDAASRAEPFLLRVSPLDAAQGQLPSSGLEGGVRPIMRKQIAQSQVEWQTRVTDNVSNQMNYANQMVLPSPSSEPRPDLQASLVEPIWLGEQNLLLAQRVSVHGEEYIQGCWLDWPGIRLWLLGRIHDLFPQADLRAAAASVARHERNGSRQLAALPVEIVAGPPAARGKPLATPVIIPLALAWCAFLLATTAVGMLLRGALALSERRGAFVSAVTHELRTPLTTLRMYSEMLAENMIRSKEKRQQYLETLHVEADRLGHLVENVLAYSRLERGHGVSRGRMETIRVEDLLDRAGERLAKRATQADMILRIDVGDPPLEACVHTDVSAVEQILFNLVDNACKYAAASPDIVLRAGRSPGRGGRVEIRVRDQGPGVAVAERRRLFKPFTKSARQAADTAPGVGLGLALGRRLARSLGGDLRVDAAENNGACFLLTLPETTAPSESND